MYKNFIKRAIDVILSLMGIIILALPMLVVALIIKIDDPGPAIFKQKRVGKNKELFMLYKFRSMKLNTPEKVLEVLKSSKNEIVIDEAKRQRALRPLDRMLELAQ